MLAAVDAADILILAAPLYVDSLPYLVTDALERIAAHRAVMPSGSTQTTRFAAILNCGFPEAQHNDVALAICEQFAEAAGLQWAGGMSMGGGGVVHGVPLAEHGPRAAGIRRALNIAADALAEGHRVPDAAISMLAQPVIPARMYTTIGNLGSASHRAAARDSPSPVRPSTGRIDSRGSADPLRKFRRLNRDFCAAKRPQPVNPCADHESTDYADGLADHPI